MRIILFIIFLAGFVSCQEIIEAPVPDLKWDAFDNPNAKTLSLNERQQLYRVYTIVESKDDFGEEADLKRSYVADKNDTTYYLSFFCAEDVRYFICQGKKTDSAILLNGYWRNVENTKTGKAHFIIPIKNFTDKQTGLSFTGVYGLFDDEPDKKLSFQFARPLYNKSPYYIVAHRGGGRSNDLLPASENSVEMILLASQLGGNGIEIDIQTTKDGVPVLFHDANISDRTTTKTTISSPIDEYSFAELQQEVNLKRGGKIPTLQQALETVLYKTPLEFVWLDCKYKEGIEKITSLQKEFIDKAASMGRKLEIVIGLPDEEVLAAFAQLPNHKTIPSLCELDTLKALQVNASIWAPSWTKGHQDEEVNAIHAKNKKASVWTVDVPDKIKECMYEAKFDGLCTNRPTMAAYYHYAKQ